MKIPFQIFYLFIFSISSLSAQDNTSHGFISISTVVGNHNIVFKSFSKSPGLSFGFNLNVGIYAINRARYSGGLNVGFSEGASRNLSRRVTSEAFNLPIQNYDKHIIFNFAQFRAGNIGWFNELSLKPNLAFYHQLGMGIFGTTEKDQLYDFALQHQVGLLFGKSSSFQIKIGVLVDHTFGTGNPNYLQNQFALNAGGSRKF